MHVPLEVVCDVVTFFESVEEVTCVDIMDPQQVCLCNVFCLHTHNILKTTPCFIRRSIPLKQAFVAIHNLL